MCSLKERIIIDIDDFQDKNSISTKNEVLYKIILLIRGIII